MLGLTLIFLIIVVGVVCFHMGRLYQRGRTTVPFVADQVVPRWTIDRRRHSDQDHIRWQSEFARAQIASEALPGRGSTTERGHAGDRQGGVFRPGASEPCDSAAAQKGGLTGAAEEPPERKIFLKLRENLERIGTLS